jgi:nucleotide-binding universal stress UspA family protein
VHDVESGSLPVAVGIGPDDDSGSIVELAADAAARLDTYLRLVHAYSVPPTTIGGLYGYDFPATFKLAGEDLLAEAASRVQASHRGVRVRQVLERGTAPNLLEKQSLTAQLVVVGQDLDKPMLARMHEGRTANHLARHSHCPVIVVPSGWDPASVNGDVIALLDTEHPDRAAHDYAVATARDRGIGLRVESIDLHAGHGGTRTVDDTVRAVRHEAALIVIAQGAGLDGFLSSLRHTVRHTVVSESTCPVAVVPPGSPQRYVGAPWVSPVRERSPRQSLA